MDISKLQKLAESLKMRADIQVGVFSGKAARSDGALTNADLAQIHEYGAPEHGIPERSMLRIPLSDHATQLMTPLRDKASMLLASGGPLKLYKLIGVAAEAIVMQAFASGGFGKWPQLKYSTLLAKLNRGKKGKSLKRRKSIIEKIYSGQVGAGILIDTGQLRRSFSSRVRMVF